MRRCAAVYLGALTLGLSAAGDARVVTREEAMRAAIHPVSTDREMRAWLGRVPLTRQFPPDLADTLRNEAPAFTIEMSTARGCVPCGDMWIKLVGFSRRYGWHASVIGAQEAMVRSGRLGLPWVGHPVVWIRAIADPNRIVPLAIGTDHSVNIARNAYLAVKMLTGVRPEVGLRAMSKYTGIVGAGSTGPRR